jgi:hypothetical protein
MEHLVLLVLQAQAEVVVHLVHLVVVEHLVHQAQAEVVVHLVHLVVVEHLVHLVLLVLLEHRVQPVEKVVDYTQ